MRRMIGATMGPGWRKAIETHLGGVQGCAHLRELLRGNHRYVFTLIHKFQTPEELTRRAEVNYFFFATILKILGVAYLGEFAAAAPPGGVSAHCFEGLYHEIFNEVDREAVFERLKGWLDARF